jgi:hypothetical protein
MPYMNTLSLYRIWTCCAICIWPAERWVGPGGGERGEERGALLLLPGALPRHHLLLQAQAPPSLLRSLHFLPVFNREVNLFVSLSKATLRIFLRMLKGNELCLLLHIAWINSIVFLLENNFRGLLSILLILKYEYNIFYTSTCKVNDFL